MVTVNGQRLISISSFGLIPNSSPEVDFFTTSGNDVQTPLLLISRTEKISASRLQRFEGQGIFRLFVTAEGYRRYQEYLQNNWRRFIEDDSLSIDTRLASVLEVSRNLTHVAFRELNTEKLVQTAYSVGKAVAAVIDVTGASLSEIRKVIPHDDSPVTNAINLAAFSVLLTKKLEYRPVEVDRISAAMVLHDVGMLSLDSRLIGKPGKLDEFERKKILQHPTIGFRMLCREKNLSMDELSVVYQHHERPDGKGYPVGLAAEEIHPWARICSVLSVFEAMISDRKYRARLGVKTALSVLRRDRGKVLDDAIVDAWIDLVQS